MSSIFEVRGLCVGVEGNEIVKGVDLTIGPGELHAIMGRNGSGKSTLAHALMGHPSYEILDGEIMVDGEDIRDLAVHERAKKGMFLSFQYPAVVPGVQVGTLLRRSLQALRDEPVKAREFRKEVNETMSMLGMDRSFLSRTVNEGFSGGERKRLEVLQLMLIRPRLAILDETDSGLDIDALRITAEGVRIATQGSATLVITHYNRILEHLKPDRIHVMIDGVFVASGGPDLAHELEAHGYDSFEMNQAEAQA